jgi:hypothetical protein
MKLLDWAGGQYGTVGWRAAQADRHKQKAGEVKAKQRGQEKSRDIVEGGLGQSAERQEIPVCISEGYLS